MRRSNALLRSVLVLGLGAGVGMAIACTGGGGQLPGDDDDDVSASSSGIGSTSGSSGIGSSSSGSSGISSSSSGGPKGPTQVTDTFSHTCNTDDDCVPAILKGTVCGFCGGSDSAIAKSDQASYQTAYNAARANCAQTGATGSCAAYYSVTQCNTASKTCQLISCGSRAGSDEHHCAPDGG